MALRTRKTPVRVMRRQEGHRRYVREQRHRTARVAVSSAIVLLFLVVVLGVIYAWYSGKNTFKSVESPKIEATVDAPTLPEPRKVDNKKPVGVAVQLLTSPVAPGEDATISIHTNPLVDCSIVVKYDNVKSDDPALITKKADEFGVVTWDWVIQKTVPEGSWPITVTCKNKKFSGVGGGNLEVTTKKQATAAQ